MTNPRRDDEHYGVVHYGTNPEDLSQTSKATSGSTEPIPRRFSACALEGLVPIIGGPPALELTHFYPA
jgi:hypothetical protein